MQTLTRVSVLEKNPESQVYRAVVPIMDGFVSTSSGPTFPFEISGRGEQTIKRSKVVVNNKVS